jgi:PmbA protein
VSEPEASRSLELVAEAIRLARRAGADQAEAYYEDRQTTAIELRNQEVEALTAAGTRGLGLRVLVGDANAYAYTPELGSRGLAALARQAVQLAREATPDPDRGLPDPEMVDATPLDLAIFDPGLADVPTEQKVELLRQTEREALACDPRIAAAENVRYGDITGQVALASSRGATGTYRRSSAWISLTLLAREDGEALRGYGFTHGHGFDQLSAGTAAAQAVGRAVKPLGGRPVPTQRATVVMEPTVAAELLGQLARALSGEAAGKGCSMYGGRLGQRVGSELVTLVDDASLPGGPASAPFDGEGIPGRRTVLVEQGLLRGFLHNSYSARRAGAHSTGNGVRQSYRSMPDVGPTNFALVGPVTPRAELLGAVERGLLVVTTRNVGGINPVSGDYSVGAAGVWIERGQETTPVAGVTIAANLLDLLGGLVAIGDDFRWTPGGGASGSGALRFEGMTIAGS